MKILHIINFMGSGGVETFLRNLIHKQMIKDEVTIITLISENTYNFDDFKEVKEKVNFIEFPFKKIYDPRIVFRLRKIVNKCKPDIVHTHLFPGQFIVPISLIGIDTKLITTEHGISLRRVNYPLFHYLERVSFSLYKKIICVSEIVNIKLKIEYPTLSQKIITINNGIDIQKVINTKSIKKCELSTKFKNSDIVVCMVGRMEKGKDFDTLINAMSFLPKNYKLLIVGKGYTEEKIKKTVLESGEEARISFFGFKKDIYYVYKSIDIFVLSSDREGLPMVLLEAMSAKKPCIGSNVDGIKDLLLDDDILFEYKNEKELATKIMNVYEKYDYYSQRSWENVQKYSFDYMFNKYEKVYSEINGSSKKNFKEMEIDK